MISYFHENLNKRIGAVAQTVYTDVYNCLRRRLARYCRDEILVKTCVDNFFNDSRYKAVYINISLCLKSQQNLVFLSQSYLDKLKNVRT